MVFSNQKLISSSKLLQPEEFGGDNPSENIRKSVRQQKFQKQIEGFDDIEEFDGQEQEQEVSEPEISNLTFGLLLSIAILLDVIGILINFFLPAAGGIVTAILITIPGNLFFLLVFYKLGLKFNTKRKKNFIWTTVVEYIPILNALPAFTMNVILNVKGKEVEEKLGIKKE